MSALRTIQPHRVNFLRSPNLHTYRSSARLPASQEHGTVNRSLPTIRTFSSSATTLSSTPKFSYNISASYSDKKKPLDPSRNIYIHHHSGKVDRHVDLSLQERELARPKSGQDSFFVARINGSEHTALGVVDGVGGWEASGVDPANFAHTLCEYMSSAASTYPSEFGTNFATPLHPRELLKVGVDKVMADKAVHAGGSTACVATISSTGVLDVANLGDSGYAHLTPFRLSSISTPQTHDFNVPFQLSKMPSKMLKQIALFGNRPCAESAADAALTSHKLSHGDVVVFATDGVWDNLSPQDALHLVSRIMLNTGAWRGPDLGPAGTSSDLFQIAVESRRRFAAWPHRSSSAKIGANPHSETAEIQSLSAILATAITHEAKVASLNRKKDGPFARQVQKYYPGENWTGGKVDDICTVVVVAIEI